MLRHHVGPSKWQAVSSIVSEVCNDMISSVRSLQVCAGHEVGCEAASHAMYTIFEEKNTEAVLLVDKANAFNSVQVYNV